MNNSELLYRSGKLGPCKVTASGDPGGVDSVSFSADGAPLIDCEIYGASGGVGDRTKNMIDRRSLLRGYWAYANGNFVATSVWVSTPKIPCRGDTFYSLRFDNRSRWYGFVWFDTNGAYISTTNKNVLADHVTYSAQSPQNAAYFIVNIAGETTASNISPSDMVNFQIEESSTATAYEPYGYKIPISCMGTTASLFINTPLGAGDQIGTASSGITVQTVNGQNTLSVNTTVKPSKIIVSVANSKAAALLKLLDYRIGVLRQAFHRENAVSN